MSEVMKANVLESGSGTDNAPVVLQQIGCGFAAAAVEYMIITKMHDLAFVTSAAQDSDRALR